MSREVIDYVKQVFGARDDRFPGCQPVSIEFKHFSLLRENDYVVCEKTDGVRHFLVFTTAGNRRISALVDRSFRVTEIPLNARKQAYDGTILDGELYDKTFLVYDAIMVEACPVGGWNFLQRLDSIQKFLKTLVTMKFDPYKVRLKTFHAINDFQYFMDQYLPTVQERVDGLVFTPVNCPVKCGTHETLFKWKPKEKNTVDFLLRWDANRTLWRLYVQEKGQLVYETDSRENHPWFRDDMIVECQYMTDDIPMWWRVVNVRTDKTYPNNRRTFYRTLVNIKEDIKMKDFLSVI